MLSVDDAFNNSIRGPLDSDNTYIAEVLLGVADDLQPNVFFREVQAGFVVSYQEPALSFCALSAIESKKLSALFDIHYDPSAFTFTGYQCNYDLTNCEEDFYDCWSLLEECITNATLSNVTSIPGDYYKTLPYNLQLYLEDPYCQNPFSLVSKIYPVQDDTMTVTIWYNNQAIHMVASAVNAFHNIFLNQVVGDGWSISSYNHPLPSLYSTLEATKEEQTYDTAFNGLAFSVLVSLGFSFFISSFVVFPVQERECKVTQPYLCK
jgi:hypothetical protein